MRRFFLPADGGDVQMEAISEGNRATDFTQINRKVSGSKHCYYWGVEWFADGESYASMAIVKYDLCYGGEKLSWARRDWCRSGVLEGVIS